MHAGPGVCQSINPRLDALLPSQTPAQGCQMVCFQTKNPNLGKFLRAWQWKMLAYFIDTWSILRSFVMFYGYLVQFVEIWYIFPVLVFCSKKNLATLPLPPPPPRVQLVFTIR
jgi:hypothetical protein